jgi:phage recombination protein Bet
MTQENGKKLVVRRALQPAAKIGTREMVVWQDRQGTEIALTVDLVRQVLPKGKYPATDAEILLFLQQARSRRANPFTGDMYLIKYAADAAAQIVVGYHHLIATAKSNPNYAGFSLHYVDGGGKRIADGLEEEKNVIAAVCSVAIKGFEEPVKFVARMKEFRKARPNPDNPWNQMPIVMLGKCAIANAHRLADPNLAGMYLPEEVGQGYIEVAAVEISETPAADTPQEAEPAVLEPPAEEPDKKKRAELMKQLKLEGAKIAWDTKRITRQMAEYFICEIEPEAKNLSDSQLESFLDYMKSFQAKEGFDPFAGQ